jgi:ParB family chromosome partitioning protein
MQKQPDASRRSSLELLGLEVAGTAAAERVLELPVTAISPNPHQPRKEFPEESLKELATSIQEHGLQNPIVVRQAIQTAAGDGGHQGPTYQLLSGERRLRAHQLAGLKTIRAIIRPIDESQMLRLALVENIHREDLSVLDRATAFCRFKDEFHSGKVEAAAEGLKISRRTGFNYAKIGAADKRYIDVIASHGLDTRDAIQLLTLREKIAKETPSKLEAFEARLAKRGVSEGGGIAGLQQEFFPEASGPKDDRKSTKTDATKSAAPWGYWNDEKSFGLRIAVKKSEELTQKQKQSFAQQAEKFFKQIGAKKVTIQF